MEDLIYKLSLEKYGLSLKFIKRTILFFGKWCTLYIDKGEKLRLKVSQIMNDIGIYSP